jgi:murein L,D-transpeptidase YafK
LSSLMLALPIWPMRRRLFLASAATTALLGAGWVLAAPGEPEPELVLPEIERIVVHKAERRMELWSGGALAHTLTGLQLGDAPVGHKQFQGDEKTPEGRYTIDYRNPNSAYHLSLHINYPRAEDTAFARAQGQNPGGQIFIHGQPNSLPAGRMPGDWTDGCIALANYEIEALWEAVPNGTPIEILP